VPGSEDRVSILFYRIPMLMQMLPLRSSTKSEKKLTFARPEKMNTLPLLFSSDFRFWQYTLHRFASPTRYCRPPIIEGRIFIVSTAHYLSALLGLSLAQQAWIHDCCDGIAGRVAAARTSTFLPAPGCRRDPYCAPPFCNDQILSPREYI